MVCVWRRPHQRNNRSRLKPNDAMRLLSDYERLLLEYTYLSLNGTKAPQQPGNWLPLS